jgi:hypothetical protein
MLKLDWYDGGSLLSLIVIHAEQVVWILVYVC